MDLYFGFLSEYRNRGKSDNDIGPAIWSPKLGVVQFNQPLEPRSLKMKWS